MVGWEAAHQTCGGSGGVHTFTSVVLDDTVQALVEGAGTASSTMITPCHSTYHTRSFVGR